MKCYNLDGIKAELRKEYEQEKALLKAWEAVDFPTKKDGKPFANMSKNISGAKYDREPYSLNSAYEYRLTVYTESNGYINDYIPCYELIRYMKDPAKIAKTENYMPKETYLEQIYKYDLDDIKAAVKARIEYRAGRVTSLEKQMKKVDAAFHAFRDGFSKLMEDLEHSTNASDPGYSNEKSSLYYMIRDTVIDRFPYC